MRLVPVCMRTCVQFSQRRIQVGMLNRAVSTFHWSFSGKFRKLSSVFMDYGLRGTDKGMLTCSLVQ